MPKKTSKSASEPLMIYIWRNRLKTEWNIIFCNPGEDSRRHFRRNTQPLYSPMGTSSKPVLEHIMTQQSVSNSHYWESISGAHMKIQDMRNRIKQEFYFFQLFLGNHRRFMFFHEWCWHLMFFHECWYLPSAFDVYYFLKMALPM